MGINKQITVLSLEQALALPYATERMVHEGWRVIRIESPASETDLNAGDPNRYIGADLGYHDLHSYYIAPNVGKEAITLNLRTAEGKQLLQRIIRELNVDIFCCNTLPKRYQQLGIDYATLKNAKPDLIWCGISAFGPEYPDKAGYDPALQAMMGYTYLTGEPNGKPVPSGIPIIDLKAGDEAFTQVVLALLERNRSGRGREINISMARCAASWLITALPQLAFVNNENELFKRSGNEHRSFIPCNVYPTRDGMVYLAIGNDSQWMKFTQLRGFESLSSPSRKTNEGRMKEKEKIYAEIGLYTIKYSTNEFVNLCLEINLAVSPVNSIKDVSQLDWIAKSMLRTQLPGGKEASLFPAAAETDFLSRNKNTLACAPRLGEHTEKILLSAGINEDVIRDYKKQGIV